MRDLVRFLCQPRQPVQNINPNLSLSLFRPIAFSQANYKTLIPVSLGRAVFIDGGNAELIRSPELSVHLIRLVGVEYHNEKRISTHIKEFYCAAVSKGFKQLKFEVKNFPIKGNIRLPELSFDSYDPTIRTGNTRIAVSAIPGIIRRFGELELAAELGNQKLLVIDGSLEATYTFEAEFLSKLQAPVIGFAKSCSLLMDGGESLIGFLASKSKYEPWLYSPIANSLDQVYRLNAAKLHKLAKFSFRIDCAGPAEELISRLASVSKDAAFLGYPYPLVFADKLARISVQEARFHAAKLLALLPSELKSKSLNFHDSLMSF